jgi:hypothetical protein
MRKGIKLWEFFSSEPQAMRAWVAESEDPRARGEWLSEDKYREGGYLPNFGELPVMKVIAQYVGSVPLDIDRLPPVDRERIRKLLKED